MRELNLQRIEIAVNKWFRDHNFDYWLTAERLDKVYSFEIKRLGMIVYTKMTERKTFDAHWEDHIEDMICSLVKPSIDEVIEARKHAF